MAYLVKIINVVHNAHQTIQIFESDGHIVKDQIRQLMELIVTAKKKMT